ncbi:MAG: hypothetical protein LBV49_02745, partial [Azonexus sp.]|nr:hypothetical protein [Azonexus sp.]
MFSHDVGIPVSIQKPPALEGDDRAEVIDAFALHSSVSTSFSTAVGSVITNSAPAPGSEKT